MQRISITLHIINYKILDHEFEPSAAMHCSALSFKSTADSQAFHVYKIVMLIIELNSLHK